MFVGAVALGALCGCASRPPATASKTQPTAATTTAARGRTQMWAENCNRCHNARPASWYSRREWAVAMHHMQVRGYLTGEETRGITEFFGAAGK
jgi:hypothetical protein